MSFSEKKDVKPEDKSEHIEKKLESIFAWIDILGFSSQVEERPDSTELVNILKRFQSQFSSMKDVEYDIISDGILLEKRIKSSDDIKKFLRYLKESQLNFILKENKLELLLRGGFAIGNRINRNKLDSGKNLVYVSPGLTRAVKIEKQVSWPIIGTNKTIINLLSEKYEIEGYQELSLCRTYNQCGEMVYFIDFLENKNDLVEEMIKRKIKNDCCWSIKQKYIWLYRYYVHKTQATEIVIDLKDVIL